MYPVSRKFKKVLVALLLVPSSALRDDSCMNAGKVQYILEGLRLKSQHLRFCGLGFIAVPATTPWFLVRNGGMDPYDSPLRSPIVVPKSHSSSPY